MTLHRKVVEEDRRLERGADGAQEALARHRWHWTLDETNPDRVGIREYARAVERSEISVRRMAHGYANWSATGSRRTLTDEIELANLGENSRAAAEAIADVSGRTPTAVRRGSRSEIASTVQAAQEAAVRRGTTIAEEIPRIAKGNARMRDSRERERHERKQNRGEVLARLELRTVTARRNLLAVLVDLRDAKLDDELVDLVTVALDDLRAILDLIDAAVVGRVAVDWDAELSKLGAS